LGWFFLHESVTLTTLLGMAFILAGVAGVFRQKFHDPR
jgi:drug/metabolite transporter (DMT)-like permease